MVVGVLMILQCDGILSSPMDRAKASAEIIAKYQPLVGHDCPSIHLWDELLPWDAGEWEMQAISKVRIPFFVCQLYLHNCDRWVWDFH